MDETMNPDAQCDELTNTFLDACGGFPVGATVGAAVNVICTAASYIPPGHVDIENIATRLRLVVDNFASIAERARIRREVAEAGEVAPGGLH